MSGHALILAAHGSRVEPAVNAGIRAWAEELAARLPFDTVTAAFHHGDPPFAEALDRLPVERFTVVPVMTSEGYFCDTLLPRELAKNRRFPRVQVRRTGPAGTHGRMLDVIARRVVDLLGRFQLEASATTLALVGHGTERHRRSRAATVNLAAALATRQVCGEVLAAFLDEEPYAETVPERATRSTIVVVPFLIGAGRHALADTPARMGLVPAKDATFPLEGVVGGRRLVCDTAVGSLPGIVDIIADLAEEGRESAGRRAGAAPRKAPAILRLGTRASALALWQARHVAERLQRAGTKVELVPLTASGDRQLDRPIAELPSDSPFTDDLDAALRAGTIDAAVHSYKDLPTHLPEDLLIAAVLPRGSVGECLVSRLGLRLADLPQGARVGTSSPRRAAQLLALRPDVSPVPIRGAVESRVQQVHQGAFDAAVLASAGLERLGLCDDICEELSLTSFLPAPGQGAMVVQVRGDDRAAAEAVRILNHPPSATAALAELELLRALEAEPGLVVAAYAEVVGGMQDADGPCVRLRGRWIGTEGVPVYDVAVEHADPTEAARRAAESLRRMRAADATVTACRTRA
ncbi:MAG: hydroxymethylbilane synthase [Planctomycetes bacterium]|nr:hydroxymethylbilane synthase [Planctomycetota bacterium]